MPVDKLPTVPPASKRDAWLLRLKAEAMCDRSRALVDILGQLAQELDNTDDCDSRTKVLLAMGLTLSRMNDADKHQERLDVARLRELAERQQSTSDTQQGLH